jgi:alpha-1,2-mannosyltransferase
MMKSWFLALGRLELVMLIACCVIVPGELIFKAICHTTGFGDFNVHRDFGHRFLLGQPLYAGDRCFNYMPVSAMFYAPLAMFPQFIASLLRGLAAMVSLFLALRWLGIMTQPGARPHSWRGITFGGLAVLLSIQYVFRDLDDGGPHLFYLGIIVGSFYFVRLGRLVLGAAGFGLVIALKMSPGLLLPFFVWKRQWRLAGYSTIATMSWIVLPALWMGPTSWWTHQSQWNRLAFHVATERFDSLRAVNEIRVQNQSLKPAVARFLVSYPPGHPLKVDHPADIAFLDLSPSTAGKLGTFAVLGLLGSVAWWSRRPYSGPEDPARVVEMAAVLILIPLLSPVTWLQHLVFVIPAIFLIVAENRAFRPLGRPALAVLWVYAILSIFLSRGFVGKPNSLVLFSYHIHTLAMLLLLGLVMWKRPTALPAPIDDPGYSGSGRGTAFERGKPHQIRRGKRIRNRSESSSK